MDDSAAGQSPGSDHWVYLFYLLAVTPCHPTRVDLNSTPATLTDFTSTHLHHKGSQRQVAMEFFVLLVKYGSKKMSLCCHLINILLTFTLLQV